MPTKKPKQRNTNRKCGRNHERIETRTLGKHVEKEIAAEKKGEAPSIAVAASDDEIHKCISCEDFGAAIIILSDPNIESEENKVKLARFKSSTCGTTVTQQAIKKNAPYELLELLVQIGGEDAVTATDDDGNNSVHCACKHGASSDVVDILSVVGGKDALYQATHIGALPIHEAALRNGASIDVVRILLAVGGREMLAHKNDYGRLPVHCSVYYFNTNLEVCRILITEGLHHGVGGEEGVGGLFTKHSDITNKQRTTFDRLKKWNLSDYILKQIENVVSEKHGCVPLEAAAKHGLKWGKGLADLVEATDDETIKEGLVILAASGESSNLATIYELVRRYVGPLFG